MHDKGYAHRDLKPENILLDHDYKLKIVDLGFTASLIGEDGKGWFTSKKGTVTYMSPEILQSKPH